MKTTKSKWYKKLWRELKPVVSRIGYVLFFPIYAPYVAVKYLYDNWDDLLDGAEMKALKIAEKKGLSEEERDAMYMRMKAYREDRAVRGKKERRGWMKDE